MSYVFIEKIHIKEIRGYLKQLEKSFKKSQVKMQESKDLIELSQSINKILSERNELYIMFDLFVHTLEQIEKYHSKE